MHEIGRQFRSADSLWRLFDGTHLFQENESWAQYLAHSLEESVSAHALTCLGALQLYSATITCVMNPAGQNGEATGLQMGTTA